MGALHIPNIGGELDADITDVGTEMSSPALAALPDIASPDFAWLCVDPDGIAGAPEWWKITAHVAAAETATVERALEGSTARAHRSGIEWVHTLAPSEVDLPAQPPLLHVRDEKAAGTNGGGFTAGAWQTRTLNTVKTNEISGASLAANQITLPAGTYEVEGGAQAFRVETHQTRLRDITGSATLLVGQAHYADTESTGGSSQESTLRGRFTLAATSVIELQHWCVTTNATHGAGYGAGLNETAVYADLMIRKVA